MPEVPFLDLAAAQREARKDLDAAYDRVMTSGRFVLGPELEAFEQEFASFCGVRYAIGVGNGLDALELLLRAHGIGSGDEVLVPSNTFIATWLAVTRCGATPVPVEPLEDTYNLDPSLVERAITPRTRAILVVHLYGLPAAMTALRELTDRHQILLLEDAAQAHGATLGGHRTGTMGDGAGFSFYPAKNLGAFGDAGCVTTDDESVAEKIRQLRNYGSPRKYEHTELGTNSRLDELQAAFLRVRLRLLPNWNQRRQRIATRYLKEIDRPDLALPVVPIGVDHAWHLFVIRTPNRDKLQQRLATMGIETMVHYPLPPHRQRAYAPLHIPKQPVAERLAAEVLSLPMGPHLTESQADLVIDAIARSARA